MTTHPASTLHDAAVEAPARRFSFTPTRDRLVCVDSDGCVFDTMEIKQKRCFHGLIAEHWRLQPIERAVREVAEFVNLYSKSRGRNRFLCLVDTFDLLRNHPSALAMGVAVPRLDALRAWVRQAPLLGEAALERAAAESGSDELAAVLRWSRAVNERIAALVRSVPPFPCAVTALRAMRQHADLVVVSQTPVAALDREWAESGLRDLITVIAGQEAGSKTRQIEGLLQRGYVPERAIMIGDSPGDEQAADAAGVRFFPIVPNDEDRCWKLLYSSVWTRFCSGKYSHEEEEEYRAVFHARMPDLSAFRGTP